MKRYNVIEGLKPYEPDVLYNVDDLRLARKLAVSHYINKSDCRMVYINDFGVGHIPTVFYIINKNRY